MHHHHKVHPEKEYDYLIALAGQPNSGKTTLFNSMTKSKGYVGNWPGKTVEKFWGYAKHHDVNLMIIDLPGTYSLSALTEEEEITIEFIVSEKPRAIVALLDVEKLEPSLYFIIQLLELTGNVVIALSKFDLAEKNGLHINTDKLSRKLGVPVVPVSALKNIGIGPLFDRILEMAEGEREPLIIDYGPLEPFIERIAKVIEKSEILKRYPPRWLALRLLEGDEKILKIARKEYPAIDDIVKGVMEEFKIIYRKNIEEHIIETRYNVAEEMLKEVIKVIKPARPSISETLDRILLDTPLSIPLSFIILFITLLTAFSINLGYPLNLVFRIIGLNNIAELLENYNLMGIVSQVFDLLGNSLLNALNSLNSPDFLKGFIIDGLIGGAGAAISFFPLIFIINVFMALLEDSGLLARVATAFNTLFRPFGISGKSAFPMVLAFGCNVPAVMSTRILEKDRERISVALTLSTIICQARLVVMLAFIAAFFASMFLQSIVGLVMYVISTITFLIYSKVLSARVSDMKEGPELLLELPAYHIPNIRVIYWISWERSREYLRKIVGTIIVINMILWILMNIGPQGVVSNQSESIIGLLSRAILPVFRPIGINHWQLVLGLIVGLMAKELIITTLAITTGIINPVEIIATLKITPLQAFSILIFAMLYSACFPTLITMIKETGNTKMTLMAQFVQFLIAYFISFIIYQLGTILGL